MQAHPEKRLPDSTRGNHPHGHCIRACAIRNNTGLYHFRGLPRSVTTCQLPAADQSLAVIVTIKATASEGNSKKLYKSCTKPCTITELLTSTFCGVASMLVRLTYASRASHGLSSQLIREILDSSQRNNPARGLTGILCCNADTFLQALEGPRSAINALYNRLADDNRHKDLTILDYEEISVRRYAHWSMGWAGAKQANRELFLKYSCSDRLDPFSMSAEQVNGLLLELSANVSTISAPIID